MKRQFDDILLGSIELFCLAAECGSFTLAAQEAGITPAAVSRSVSRLEERLGVRLFTRTTRNINLTEAGKNYFQQSNQALLQLREAERDVMGKQNDPSGTLRISLPTTYGHYRILPLLPQFRAQYPKVKVDIHLSNRNVDFVSEGYDIAIRVRSQPDSTLIARTLEDARLVVVASPAYLKNNHAPQTLEELSDHECIQFELPSSGRKISWLFYDERKEREIMTTGSYCCSDDVLGGLTLAVNGAGLFQTYAFVAERYLSDGSLTEVLTQYRGRSRPYTLLYPLNRHLPLRVRVFIDFLMEHRQKWK
ncbi:TPA: LysR family transcriptional regulator [Enterobacter chuandaensis]|uniref:LysR family transcriptional regulator n=1 Tax=Enterobacter nematophilus TaxID=2994648 RepID=UPI001D56EA39|nr:LysR family transcriptional regulator [Enterobacter cloacae]HDR2621535.1 LysR family transcriptional regulator [Enterobacter chuandaensis]